MGSSGSTRLRAPPNSGTTAPTMWTWRCAAPAVSPSGPPNGKCCWCRERASPTSAPCSRSLIPASTPSATRRSALLHLVVSGVIDVGGAEVGRDDFLEARRVVGAGRLEGDLVLHA